MELAGDDADRLEARRHHAVLQVAGDDPELAVRRGERSFVVDAHQLADAAARQHQLTDQVHELVENGDVDPDGALASGAGYRWRVQRCHAVRSVDGRGAAAVSGRQVPAQLDDELGVLVRGLSAAGLDLREYGAGDVDQTQEGVGSAGSSTSCPARSASEQVLAGVRQRSPGSKPRKPQVPLMVWIDAKHLDSSSGSFGRTSRSTRSRSS